MSKDPTASPDPMLPEVLRHSPTRVVFGPDALSQIGNIAATEGATRVLLVTDPGIVAAGHVERAVTALGGANIDVVVFDGVAENPTTQHVEAGVTLARKYARRDRPFNLLVGLGGGSSMDCAKGINFLYSGGGKMTDYWGVGKATQPMLPMIAVPTTAGTGSEAQSFALISDPVTHQKMACGDKKAACRVAILDPKLTRTQPAAVAAMTGFDAISHAVETAATTRRNEVSLQLSCEAWRRLERSFETAVTNPSNEAARAEMLVGAHLAGAAIERSMLGAAHACANPLTARFSIPHGAAIALVLPHVVRFNAGAGSNPYAAIGVDADELAGRLTDLRRLAGLKSCLADCGVTESSLGVLAQEAVRQWTARFNPVTVGDVELERIYRCALHPAQKPF